MDNDFDFNAYMHKVMNKVNDGYWYNDSEFTVHINNCRVISNKYVKDAVVQCVDEALSIIVPSIVEFVGIKKNRLMFRINEIGKTKKDMILDIFDENQIDENSKTLFFRYDRETKYLLIVRGNGEVFVELTNVEPNEMHEAIVLSQKHIEEGYKVLGGYDLMKKKYEKTGSIS